MNFMELIRISSKLALVWFWFRFGSASDPPRKLWKFTTKRDPDAIPWAKLLNDNVLICQSAKNHYYAQKILAQTQILEQ